MLRAAICFHFHFMLLAIVSWAAGMPLLWGQNAQLTAGPMPGHVSDSSVKVWLLTKNVRHVSASLTNPTTGEQRLQSRSLKPLVKNYAPFTLSFNGLQPATAYVLRLTFDKQPLAETWRLRTSNSEASADFSFLTGSCALMPPKGLKWLYPGKVSVIYDLMRAMPADFMLWLGDNLYYRPGDSKTFRGMVKRQIKKRKVKRLNRFLCSRPQYAVWDDHDYGPNNSDGSFALKDSSLLTHTLFWPNPAYGTSEVKGAFSKFSYSDCDFFLLDCRYHRNERKPERPTLLGSGQLSWLKKQLLRSTATFKFIALGSQVLNEVYRSETYILMPEERQELLDFLHENGITGVIFLTGDRHHTELLKLDQPGNPVYDLTCSPLSSLTRNTERTAEADNPLRIPNTLTTVRNFGRITVSGPEGQRVCLIEIFDNNGSKLWQYRIETPTAGGG